VVELISDRADLIVWRSPIRRHLAVIGLTGFAVSQPLLAVFGDNPSTLSFHHTGRAELVVLALLIGLVPPLLLIVATAAVGWVDERAGRMAHLGVVGALATISLVQWTKTVGPPPPLVVLGVAVAIGAGFTVAYVRVPPVTRWTSYTAFLPLLAVGTFLIASPSSALLQKASAPGRVDSDAPSLVMIVLDELPTRSLVDGDGELDAERFPNFAAFAEDATWYRHHTSLAPFTEFAVPSLLTGDDPRTDPPIDTSYPDNLFSLLAPTHDLEVMEVATRLCAYEGCEPQGADTGPGFTDLLALVRDVFVERIKPTDPGPTALDDFNEDVDADPAGSDQPAANGGGFVPNDAEMRATSVRADTFRSTFDANDPRTLYYLHLLLPHQPWRFRGDGAIYRDADPLSLSLPADDRAVSRSWSRWDSIVSEQRHVLQAQYVDALIGQILDDLRAKGLYEDSMVVITADHGISFEPRTPPRVLDDRGGASETLDAIAYSPLFVKLPGQTSGGIDDSNVMAIDVLPTIAETLGVEVDFEMDGVPIGSPEMAQRGGKKRFHNMVSVESGMEDRSVVEFDDAVIFATVPGRLLGPLTDPQDPLSAMQDLLPVGDVIGAPVADLHARGPTDGAVLVNVLGALEHPGEAPYGVVTGRAEGVSDAGAVLLAVDGTVVAGSEISTASDGQERVIFLLPEGALDAQNEIDAFLVEGDVVRELELRPG